MFTDNGIAIFNIDLYKKCQLKQGKPYAIINRLRIFRQRKGDGYLYEGIFNPGRRHRF